MDKNPPWTRDELILALDLYFRVGRKQPDASHPEVVELSRLLNQLPIHPPEVRGRSFRNPQGVAMKLGNFLSIDPEYEGVGLSRRSKLDQEIWDEFAGDLERLHKVAEAIRRSVRSVVGEGRVAYEVRGGEGSEEEFPEGRILTRLHRRQERNRRAVERKKQLVLEREGRLACEVCGFDFAEVYGDLGYGFAECHHTVPVAELGEGHQTRLSELAIVCANCHRILHRSRPLLSVEELREIVVHNRKRGAVA